MATIKDVARESGLTVGTVSRVLNNRGYISQETREKVFAVMERLNYQPNEMARSLSRKKTNTIGLIVPHIVHPYFAKLISNVENVAAERKYKILLCNTKRDQEREKDYLDMCKSNRVAGIIICSTTIELESLLSQEVPIVTFECFPDAPTASVMCDNLEGGRMAAEKLIASGCRNLLNLTGFHDLNSDTDDLRERGFFSVCREKKIPALAVKNSGENYYGMEYYDYIEKVLTDHPEVDGIFASSDLIAAQVIQVCHKRNIRIPEDLKLIGFDDVNIASLTSPRITSIHQPVRDMAETAVDLIIRKNKGEIIPVRSILPVRLVERESC